MLKKVSSVGTVALNAATAGIFGELVKASKAITLGVKCGQKLFTATSSLKSYVDELQANGTEAKQLLALVNQSDLVVNQLPAAVSTCLGLPVSEETLKLNAQVAGIVNQIVTEVVANGASLLHPQNFLAYMSDLGVDDSIKDMDGDSVAQLQDVLTSGVNCGSKLQQITDKVTKFVVAVKENDPSSSISAIRQALSVSELLVSDIPTVTNNCVRNVTGDAYSMRDSLRSIMSTIVDGIVDNAEDKNGKATSTADYLVSVAKMGLDVIGILDPTGIAGMLSAFTHGNGSGDYAGGVQVGDTSEEGSGSDSTAVQVGDSSESESGSGSSVDGSNANVTPAPTTPDNASQVDQGPPVDRSNGSDEVDATPAPTTPNVEIATPAPTTFNHKNATPAPNNPKQATPALCES
ncbi:Protocadherin protein [Phytophthora cinnamomi]|uniref:Protocadherin protein n=1 Tax=Phytophthora cinnamomi TaxID=4785 RepID=UPI0035595DDE|nr:Protocadherin protein [Phytophthora cinnamomi]